MAVPQTSPSGPTARPGSPMPAGSSRMPKQPSSSSSMQGILPPTPPAIDSKLCDSRKTLSACDSARTSSFGSTYRDSLCSSLAACDTLDRCPSHDASAPRDSLDACDNLYSFPLRDGDASALFDGLCGSAPRDAPCGSVPCNTMHVGDPMSIFQILGRNCGAGIGDARCSSEAYSRVSRRVLDSHGPCQGPGGGGSRSQGDPDREAALAAEVEVLQRQVDDLQLALHDAEDRHSRQLAALVEVRPSAKVVPSMSGCCVCAFGCGGKGEVLLEDQ